jgi:trimeric autotransporter adhesin
MSSGRRSFLFLIALAFSVSAAFAQSGVVKSNGLPLPGAIVTATLGDRKLVTTTDENGRYSFEGMTTGTWQAQVDLFGFSAAKKQIEIGTTPVFTDWTLELKPMVARRGPANGSGGFQVLQNQAEQQVSQALSAQPAVPGVTPEDGTTTEAFLVNGSISRGIQQGEPDTGQQNMEQFRQMRTGAQGPGGPGGGTGGFGGGAPGGGMGGRGGFGGGQGRQGERRPGGQQGAFFGNRAQRNNQVRGSVFFSFRNSGLDAAPYSLNGQPADKPSYDQYRFGFSVGGPLIVPKLFKSPDTFFFINYFGTRADNPVRGVATVPTAAQRSGDFLGLGAILYDPLSRSPFGGNQVPLNRLDPAALGLLKYIPLPNQPGGIQNYVFSTTVPQHADNLNTRLNRNLTTKDRLAVTFNYQRRDANNAQTYGFVDQASGNGINTDLSWTRTLSARSVNTVHLTFNRNTSDTLPYFAFKDNVAAALGIEGASLNPINYGPPNLSFTNYGALSDASAAAVRNQSIGLVEGATWTHGSHNFAFGGEMRWIKLNTHTDQNGRGSFTFSGLKTSDLNSGGLPLPNTGWDFADFLLGLPQSSSIQYGSADTYFRSRVYATYAQDDWRVRPNLSLTLGVRYEYFTPLNDKYGRIANLDIAPGFTGVAVVTPGKPGPYTGAFPDYLINPDKNNWSPRLGFAWKPKAESKTQFRGGYGIYYNEGVYNTIAARMAAQPPFAQTSSVSTSLTDPLTIETGLVTIPAGKTILNTFAVDRNYRVPYAQTWSSSIQREFAGGIVVEAGYLGTKGTRLDIQGMPNRAAPGSPLTAEERRQIGNAVGFVFESSEGNSIYHALQVRVARRFRRGLSVNGLYTFGKSIDNSSTFGGAGNTVAQDANDLRAERGLSSFDRRQTLASGFVLTSPAGTRNGLLEGHPWALRLLRDWTLNGRVSLMTGTPLTARVLGNLADAGGTGSVGSGRADATGLSITGGAFFDLAAFTLPPSGRYGDAGRNTIPGPGSFSLNSSFGRSFSLSERRRLEFRLEATNLTNHVNIGSIGTVVNSNTYGIALAAGAMRTMQGTVRFRF